MPCLILRSILFDAKLPLKFWAEAVNTVVYSRNRSPTSSLEGRTPFEFYYGQKPDVSNLRVFGSVCFVHIPDNKRQKLDPKSYKAVFVGYPNETKGYKVYNLENGKFARSRNILFHEKKFHDFEKDDLDSSEINFPDDETIDDLEVPTPLDTVEKEHNIENNVDNNVEESTPIITVTDNDDDQQPQVLEDPEDEPEVEQPAQKKQIYETYEETFMQQVEQLSGKRERKPRDRLVENAYLVEECNIVESLLSKASEPKSFNDALKSEKSGKWKEALQSEMDSLKQNDTWL